MVTDGIKKYLHLRISFQTRYQNGKKWLCEKKGIIPGNLKGTTGGGGNCL